MSFVNRALSPAPRVSAEAIERALAAIAQVEPDPLFRRHLRSEVVNRYVAAREGLATPERLAPDHRSRTGRIGRACLYASFSLAATAASVMAAAQEALPGAALYGVKLRVEELRFDVMPDHLHADLVAYALGERIEEMDRLAAAGALDEAIGLVPAIEHEFARLEALATASPDADEARIERHLVVLSGLLERLPDAAQSAVQDVVNGVNGLGGQNDSDGDINPNAGAGGSGANASTPARGQGVGGTTNIDDETPAPDRTPGPEATPRPEPTQRPDRTPRPEPTIKPAPDRPSEIEDDQD